MPVYKKVAYGLSDSLLNVFAQPVSANRNPTANDRNYDYGTIWVNVSANDAFVLTSVAANVANWVGVGGGTGTFTSVTVTPGNLTVTNGNIAATAGSVSAGTTVTAGTGINASTGNIVASTGSIIASLGSVTAATTISGAGVVATGDAGGFATTNSFTNVVNTTQGAGALTLLSTNGNSGTNTGFLKWYVGLTPVYVPYFATIAP